MTDKVKVEDGRISFGPTDHVDLTAHIYEQGSVPALVRQLLMRSSEIGRTGA